MDAASHEAWSIDRLAEVSGVSKGHFARSFKQAFGLPPHRYLLTRRIEQATTLLRDTDLDITEIAFATGWESLGTFGRTFRDITGESPGAVRSRARADGHPPVAGPVRALLPGAAGRAPAASPSARVPPCFLSAAQRPHLTTAVSEKRRRSAPAINETTDKEVP
jgi:AraC-like DNA-binding protein